MKLPQLKAYCYDLWCELAEFNDAIPQADGFQREIRALFGDLRRKATWEKALVRFYAQMIHTCCLDACTVILYSLNLEPNDTFYEYRYAIFEEFLTYPESLDLLRSGLEQIFNSSDFTPQQRQETRENGFFAMVREQSLGGILHGRAVEFIGQLAGAG